MTDKQLDGIEILVEMSKTGKIDPWNIDIVDVTDKFLHELVERKSDNLRLTGRTLFFAAVLLRLKSDILENKPVQEEPEEFYEDNDSEFNINDININNLISLEDVLVRRTSIKLHRKRVVTLKDLIKQLEFYEEIEKKRSFKNSQERAKRRARSYADFSAEDIIEMAHDEYIEEGISKLQSVLQKLFETDEKIELSELRGTGMDKVSTYIALLFLATRSRIELVQEEFYSNLYITKSV
ncbi:MAG: segregation/condensation protein A [bacterium]